MATTAVTRKALILDDVVHLLRARVLYGKDMTVKVVEVGAADLMSDVLALSKPGMLILTGLVSVQVIRTAIVSDLCGVIFVRGKKPGREILDLAREANIPVLGTDLTMFEAAGVLYGAIFSG